MFLPSGSHLSLPQVGNLGEFICLIIERAKTFSSCRFYPANGHRPLNTISNDGVDIIWLNLADDPQDDFIALQEIKTTGDPALTIHRQLVNDYKKHFGPSPAQTLATALQAVKARLVLSDRKPEWARRVTKMAGISPATVSKIHVMPSIVHDITAVNSEAVLLRVRTAIAALKWPPELIHPRSIALTDLMNRLEQLSRGI
jgi:hypothetical protein